MIKALAALTYMIFIPWGAFQFAVGRGSDWLVFAIAGLIFWDSCFMEGKK